MGKSLVIIKLRFTLPANTREKISCRNSNQILENTAKGLNVTAGIFNSHSMYTLGADRRNRRIVFNNPFCASVNIGILGAILLKSVCRRY